MRRSRRSNVLLLIDRRSFGLYDIGQQSMLRQLAESLSSSDAPTRPSAISCICCSSASASMAGAIRARCRSCAFVAGWRADAGDFISARAIYRRAIALVEQKLGPNDPAAVEPLRALAAIYTQEV